MPKYDLSGKRVWVAGHRGMVGAAILRRLQTIECTVLTATRRQLDLRRQAQVEDWVASNKPDAVFVAAATVGGIFANDSRPAEFLYDNLVIETNVIEASYKARVQKLLFLGSSCIYPRLAPQPIREESLLTGPLEQTNEWYAVAKIAGIKMCQAYRKQYGCDYISAMPTNLYGPGDNYDLASSHVVAALITKAHSAKQSGSKELVVWGTGTPRREFMYVDDVADALVFLMEQYSGNDHVNIGVGSDLTIAELAELVIKVVGLPAEIMFDRTKPDGTPRKLMDSSRLLAMGWAPRTALDQGLAMAYADYRRQADRNDASH